MSITRAPLRAEQPYTVFANDLLNDESLSADALGVLVYLLSKPPNWKVLPGPLGKRFGCGRDKIYRIMNELIVAGYATRYQDREGGSFSEQNFLVSNEKAPLPENPEAANPDTVNPQQQKKDSKKERLDSRPAKQQDAPYSEEFENDIWKPYPRKLNASKKKAWDLWRMLTPERQAQVKAAIPVYAENMRREGRPEDKIKHLQFWISERVYETVSVPAAASSAMPATDWYKTLTRDQWIKILIVWSDNWNWSKSWGPEPGKPDCAVPQDILDRFDVKYRGHLFSPEEMAEKKERISRSRDGGSAAPPPV